MSSAVVTLMVFELTVGEEGMSVFVTFKVLSASCVVYCSLQFGFSCW